MSSLLRRLTTQLDQTTAIQSGPEEGQFQQNQFSEVDTREKGKLASAVSFNDFSMHVMLDGDHQVQYDEAPCDASTRTGCQRERPITQPMSIPNSSQDMNMSPIDKARTPPSPLFISKTLKVPRTSVASILGTPKASTLAAAETPRSSLDLIETSSMPTPRASLSSRDAEGDGSVPVSPRSPKTPGGKRKKQNKIHGLDYYEFCELVRAGSL